MGFFERMERTIDFQMEYEKLEHIVLYYSENGETIENAINSFFTKWRRRQNYVSFSELRHQCGFSINVDAYGYYEIENKDIHLEDFLAYIEMITNLIEDLGIRQHGSYQGAKLFTETAAYDLEQIGYEMKSLEDGRVVAVKKNAAALAVADKVKPIIGDNIIEYNHYLLKGNLQRKRELLDAIAHDLEAKRSKIRSINNKVEDGFFYLVNNMNIRHNNVTPDYEARFNPEFANLSTEEQEDWYDLIYEQGLMCYMLLEQEKRSEKIRRYKVG